MGTNIIKWYERQPVITNAVPSLVPIIDLGQNEVLEGGKHVICDVLVKKRVSTFFLFSKTTSLIFSGPPKVRKFGKFL